MRLILEGLGYVVEEAVDGPQALERVSINPPDLLILDLVMPGMTGLEVLSFVQKLNAELPVVIATSDVQRATAESARQRGARALVNKPLVRDEVQSVVMNALAGGHSWPT